MFPGCNKWLAPLLRREAYTTSANYSRRNERDLLGSYLSWNIKIVRVSFGYEDLERHEWISYTTRCWRCVERARFWTKITSEIERNISTIILLKLKEISERLNFVIGLSEFFTKFNLSKVSSVQRFTRNTFFTLNCKNRESLKVFEYTYCMRKFIDIRCTNDTILSHIREDIYISSSLVDCFFDHRLTLTLFGNNRKNSLHFYLPNLCL